MASGTITAAAGSFVLVLGTSTSFSYTDRTLNAVKGTFTETGQAATLSIPSKTLTAGAGAFTETGVAAGLAYSGSARTLTAAAGGFTLNLGTSTSVLYTDRTLSAAKGTFDETGQTATLTYGTTGRTLTAAAGTFVLSGDSAVPEVFGDNSPGAFALNLGTSTSVMLTDRTLAGTPGEFAASGFDAILGGTTRSLVAEHGTFSETGIAAGLTYVSTGPRTLTAATGAFHETGSLAALTYIGAYSIAANAADRQIQTFLLIKADFAAGTVYWTNADIPLVTGSPARTDCAPAATWTPKPLRITQVTSRQGANAGGTVEIGNADNALSQILFGANNPTGTPVHVWEAWFNPLRTTAIPDDTTQLDEGRIDSFRMKTASGTAVAVLTLAPPIDFAARVFPRRRVTQKCSFIYKSAACQADGSDTSCDGTLTACSLPTKRAGNPAGGNRANFGGFPMLPSMGV